MLLVYVRMLLNAMISKVVMIIDANANRKKAFSLVELSIVIVIFSILATLALSLFLNDKSGRGVIETKNRIDQIYLAMGKFLVINGRLPCPSSLKLVRSDINYAVELGNPGECIYNGIYSIDNNLGSVNLLYGAVPAVSLGLPKNYANDAYGAKFVYVVDANHTRATSFPISGSDSFVTAASNDIISIVDNKSGSPITVTNDAIFAIVSYGLNKAGAFNFDVTAQNDRSSVTDEQNNDATSFNDADPIHTAIYDNTLVEASAQNEFDDILFYRTKSDLMKDFANIGAQIFNFCQPSTVGTINCIDYYSHNDSATTYSASWAAATSNQLAASTTECPAECLGGTKYSLRKCNEDGSWSAASIKCVTNP